MSWGMRGILIILVSYLLGSVNFACIITKVYSGKDIREEGSGNAGMTNVMRFIGKLPGMLTLVGDIAKVIIAISVSRMILGEQYQGLLVLCNYMSGFFCIIGHLYPVFFQFRGGKGVAVSFGTMLMIDYRVVAVALAVFLATLLIWRMVSLSSMAAAVAFPISTFLLYEDVIPENPELSRALSFFYNDQRALVTILAVLFMLIVIIKHIPNIKRIVRGEESKIGIKKKRADGGKT